MRPHSATRECVRRGENMPTTMTMTTTVSAVSMQRCVCARRRAATTTKKMKTAWRNGLNRPNVVAVASSSNDDSWNAAIGKEKVRVTADERVVLFEFGVDPVWKTTTEVEDETTRRKREEDAARADDEAFVESVVSLTAEQSQEEEEEEEESVKETAVSKPTTTTPSLSKMKKAELVALCEELGVDSTGTVPALRGRLGPVLRARAK